MLEEAILNYQYLPQAAGDCFITVFRRYSIFRLGRCIKNLFLVNLHWRKIENLLRTALKQSSAACDIYCLLEINFMKSKQSRPFNQTINLLGCFRH